MSELLDLPPELSQHIFSFVDRGDTLNLRLVSKQIDKLVFDCFAAHYLASVACCVVEVGRIRHLEGLMSLERLRPAIKNVKLTTDIMEGINFRTLHLAPQSDKSHEKAQLEAYHTSMDEHDEACADKSLGENAIRWMLRDLKRTDITLSVNVYSTPHACRAEANGKHLLRLIVTEGFPIGTLGLGEQILGRLLMGEGHEHRFLRRLTKNTQEFVCCQAYIEPQVYEQQQSSIEHLLSSMSQLKILSLQYVTESEGEWMRDYPDGPTRALSSARSACLEELDLEEIWTTPSALIAALRSSYSSLQGLTLTHVHLMSEHTAWSEVLRTILSLPRLEKLELRALKVGHDLERELYMASPSPGYIEVDRVKIVGREEIKSWLTLVLEKGINYDMP